MADDLTVRFGGDTSALSKSIADARSSVTNLGGSLSTAKTNIDSFNAAMQTSQQTSAKSSAGWRENIATISQMAIIYDVARRTMAESNAAYTKAMESWAAENAKIQSQINGAAFHAVSETVRDASAALQAAPSAFMAWADAAAHGVGVARSFIHEQQGIAASIARRRAQASRHCGSTHRMSRRKKLSAS